MCPFWPNQGRVRQSMSNQVKSGVRMCTAIRSTISDRIMQTLHALTTRAALVKCRRICTRSLRWPRSFTRTSLCAQCAQLPVTQFFRKPINVNTYVICILPLLFDEDLMSMGLHKLQTYPLKVYLQMSTARENV